MVRDRVDGIDLVLAIEVGVEAVHHHDEFLPLPVLGRAEEARAGNVGLLGMTRRIGIDDEGAVHALMDVPLQRQCMAVIEVASEGDGIELVGERFTGADLAGAGDAIHAGRMNAVEVHRVTMRAVVVKQDLDPVALGGPQTRARHPAIVSPRWEEDARRDFDLLVLAGDLERSQRAAVWQR
jgi:hypothetical protein